MTTDSEALDVDASRASGTECFLFHLLVNALDHYSFTLALSSVSDSVSIPHDPAISRSNSSWTLVVLIWLVDVTLSYSLSDIKLLSTRCALAS